MGHAEAVPERRREQTRPRRRTDQREGRQVERHHPGAGPLAHRDRQPVVLHRGVEGLLERARQAVDLVDEEHRARLERREERGDVALALEPRAGRLHERHVELVRDDLRERRLAEPRRPRQQYVVERLAACAGRLDEDGKLILHRPLAHEVPQEPRPQRAVELLVHGRGGRRLYPVDAGRPDAAAHRAAFSASAISSSAVWPSALSSRTSISRASKPSPSRPWRASDSGSSVFVTTNSSSGAWPATFSRSSTMMRSAVRLPMPGTAWKRAEAPFAIAFRSSRVVPPLSTARASFGPTDWTPVSMWNSSRSSSLAKPKRCIPSSLRTRCACRSISLSTAGTRLSVCDDTARR